mgnify:CR=1 FL=1
MLCEGRIISEELSLEKIVNELVKKTSSKGAGALTIFMGYVKGLVNGVKVKKLVYEAYEPYASRKLQEIACSIANKYSAHYVGIFHRIGSLEPGEVSVYIIIATTSRHESFEAVKEAIERVKRDVPIFKLEKRENGDFWIVGNGIRIPKREPHR